MISSKLHVGHERHGWVGPYVGLTVLSDPTAQAAICELANTLHRWRDFNSWNAHKIFGRAEAPVKA